MIQLRRGSTKSWLNKNTPILADGQPGYDKEKHKIKVGDGKTTWSDLPYASGLTSEEILRSESDAKKYKEEALITYGETTPDKNTIGNIYLQYYDTEPEVDYVIASGVSNIWTYQVFKSGIAKCWGRLPITTAVQNSVGNGMLFNNETMMSSVSYPFTFDNYPVETVSLISAKNKIAWLAGLTPNTESVSGVYTILSFDKHTSATYYLALNVEGTIDIYNKTNKAKLGI